MAGKSWISGTKWSWRLSLFSINCQSFTSLFLRRLRHFSSRMKIIWLRSLGLDQCWRLEEKWTRSHKLLSFFNDLYRLWRGHCLSGRGHWKLLMLRRLRMHLRTDAWPLYKICPALMILTKSSKDLIKPLRLNMLWIFILLWITVILINVWFLLGVMKHVTSWIVARELNAFGVSIPTSIIRWVVLLVISNWCEYRGHCFWLVLVWVNDIIWKLLNSELL